MKKRLRDRTISKLRFFIFLNYLSISVCICTFASEPKFCTDVANSVLKHEQWGEFNRPTNASRSPQDDGSVIFAEGHVISRDREGRSIMGGSVAWNIKFIPQDNKTGMSKIIGMADIDVFYPTEDRWKGEFLNVSLNQDCRVDSVYYFPGKRTNIPNPPFTINATVCDLLGSKIMQYQKANHGYSRPGLNSDEDKFTWEKSFSPSASKLKSLSSTSSTMDLTKVIEADASHIKYDPNLGLNSPWFSVYSMCEEYSPLFSHKSYKPGKKPLSRKDAAPSAVPFGQ